MWVFLFCFKLRGVWGGLELDSIVFWKDIGSWCFLMVYRRNYLEDNIFEDFFFEYLGVGNVC